MAEVYTMNQYMQKEVFILEICTESERKALCVCLEKISSMECTEREG